MNKQWPCVPIIYTCSLHLFSTLLPTLTFYTCFSHTTSYTYILHFFTTFSTILPTLTFYTFFLLLFLQYNLHLHFTLVAYHFLHICFLRTLVTLIRLHYIMHTLYIQFITLNRWLPVFLTFVCAQNTSVQERVARRQCSISTQARLANGAQSCHTTAKQQGC